MIEDARKRVIYVPLMNKVVKKNSGFTPWTAVTTSRVHFTQSTKTCRVTMQSYSDIFRWDAFHIKTADHLPHTGNIRHVKVTLATHYCPSHSVACLPLWTCWQSAAATTAKLPHQPCVNGPIRVNVKLSCAVCAGQAKPVCVKGALNGNYYKLFSQTPKPKFKSLNNLLFFHHSAYFTY